MYQLPKEFQWVNRLKKYDGNPILRPQGEIAKDNIENIKNSNRRDFRF